MRKRKTGEGSMKNLTFDRKMIRFISWALVLSTSVILIVSAVSTVISVTRKSTQMAMKEVEAMTTNTEDSFGQYYGLIWAIALDEHIQNYVQAEEESYAYVDNANSVLDNICNMWDNINFISIVREDDKGHLVKGNSIPNWMNDYKKNLEEDYEHGIGMRHNVMQMSFTKKYNINGEYSLSVYYPLYSNSVIGHRLGTICINVDDTNLMQLVSNEEKDGNFDVDTYFVHKDGNIISSTNPEEIASTFEEMNFDGRQNISTTWGNMLIYKKLDGWNFYYITRISWWELLKGSVWTIVLLTMLLSALMVVIIRFAKGMVTKAYEPWGNVVKAMGKVSTGELETRLLVSKADPDMQVVSNGFNGMMEQLIKLMEQVKEEQYQMDQIRMEALHSQIQPHFLYNTLDCIHWQAVASGNQDVSKMVKALASYYRICLSKGKDIITIGQELEYTKNYLYIQQMRYDEILSYEIESAEELKQSVIPKLTLQPLVENAIYHGIKRAQNRKGCITISVTGDEKQIRIEVSDNGEGMTNQEIQEMNQMIALYDEQFGYGVRNVNRRIQLYYGQEYGLTYSKNKDCGITVTIELPNREALKEGNTVLS